MFAIEKISKKKKCLIPHPRDNSSFLMKLQVKFATSKYLYTKLYKKDLVLMYVCMYADFYSLQASIVIELKIFFF